MTDESTDIGTIKTSCVVARFYDESSEMIENVFWQLHNVYDTDNPSSASAEHLYNGLISTLNEYEIPLTNIIGFGSDGCNVMMGQHNSVVSRLRESCPGIFIMKCVCHSAHLCASEFLPSEFSMEGRTLGVTLGCFLGMFPLLLKKDEESKDEKSVEEEDEK
ncbi:unnamed protein product [Macrosiphum euphorbiae]|uniref:DUF4371 domain-containing protein n=1 Tax=Macrosiphum euphorbiae TaxID=13131 RepID=A0AAV0WB81_9HEMI|nr:unnamed protein product [Macrosiphum euphorbiae]